MKEWNGPRTRLDTKTAGSTRAFIDDYGASLRVYREGTDGTSFHARIVITLRTEMRYLHAWKGHEDSNTRRLRPDPTFVLKAADYFTPLTAGTANVISNNPNTTQGTNPSLFLEISDGGHIN
jgi:hypothetical protein